MSRSLSGKGALPGLYATGTGWLCASMANLHCIKASYLSVEPSAAHVAAFNVKMADLIAEELYVIAPRLRSYHEYNELQINLQ